MTYPLKQCLSLLLVALFCAAATSSAVAGKSAVAKNSAAAEKTMLTGEPHHQHSSPATECDSAQSLPSLDCGQAPSATFTDTGRLWVAWALGGHVYVNYSDDEGSNFSTPVAVNKTPEMISARAENRPKIKVDGQGRLHISWTKALAKRFSGDVRYSRSDDGGQSFITPVTVNDNHDPIGHRFESLGVSTEGRVYIAWIDKRDREIAAQQGQEYFGAALYYSYADPGSAVFKTNIKIADNSCECCRIALDIAPDGLPVLLWRHIYGDNIRDHALVRFRSADQPLTPVRVSHENWQIEACPHHGPALSISAQGRYHAIWFNDGDHGRGLFYAYSKDAGQRYSPPISVGDYNKHAAHPAVIAIGNRVYLSWKEFDGEKTQILVQQSNDGGKQWGLPKAIASTRNASDHPLLINNGTQVFLSWHARAEGYRVIPIEGALFDEK